MMTCRIVRAKLELDLVEGQHFGPMTKEATTEQILHEAKRYLYPFLKDQIAGGEIDDWMQLKLEIRQESGDT